MDARNTIGSEEKEEGSRGGKREDGAGEEKKIEKIGKRLKY